MQAQYNNQSLAQAWHNLDLKRFWLKEIVEGYWKSLTTILDHSCNSFCSAKASIYKCQRKLVVSSHLTQFLSNSVDQSVQAVSRTALAVANLPDSINRIPLTKTSKFSIQTIFQNVSCYNFWSITLLSLIKHKWGLGQGQRQF